MKANKKEKNNQNSLNNNIVRKTRIESILNQINDHDDRKKLHKILKYLTKFLNIDIMDIAMDKVLYSDEKKFYPTFACYHNNRDENNDNLLLTCIYVDEKKDLTFMASIAKQYFLNFDNLFFVLIFNYKMQPFLFFRKETDENIELLIIEEKNIKPFTNL